MVQGYVDDYHCDTISEERRDFVNGFRPSILLDFNVDGNIWDKMWEINGVGTGNPYQDMLDYAYLLTNNLTKEKMSIENEEYN